MSSLKCDGSLEACDTSSEQQSALLPSLILFVTLSLHFYITTSGKTHHWSCTDLYSRLVQVCTALNRTVQPCTDILTRLYQAMGYTRLCKACTRLYQAIQVCTSLYKAVQVCTGLYKAVQLYKSVQVCTGLYRSVQGCAMLYKAVRVCTSLYKSVQVYTGLYKAV